MSREILQTPERHRVLSLIAERREVPHSLRSVALDLEFHGKVFWRPGGSFGITPAGHATAQLWAYRARQAMEGVGKATDALAP